MRARTKSRGVRRLLDGWGAGLLILLIAGSSIALSLPRAVSPTRPPTPQVDAEALAATMARDDARALRAIEETLDVDVRAVGRELRAYNRAAAEGQKRALVAARRRLVKAAGKALRHGDEPLLALRAYQMRRFIDELRRWQRSDEASDELRALGGDFLETAHRNRWCRQGSRRLLLGERELRVLFKKRWNDLVGVSGPAFALTLDEDRVRYGLLLRRPFRPEVGRSATSDAPRLAAVLDRRQQLRTINALAQRDPAYPADLARGIVQHLMGHHAKAVSSFRRHLEARADGPYTLRARNHLKAALDRTAM